MTLVVALVATACGDPIVPSARSTTAELVMATVEAEPSPVPTPTPEPTATPVPAGIPAPTPAPVSQPGLTNDSIRIAVIFDDETAGAADNLFRDAWLGTRAWSKAVNDAGGLGGRSIDLVPLDSRLFDHRSAIEEVCAGDYFAIVGSHSLDDATGAELLGTEDCNIADFPGAVYGSRRAASPVTFVSNPLLNDIRQAGPAFYLAEKYPEAAQNLGLYYYIALDLQNATERQREMLQAAGMEVTFSLTADLEEDPVERMAPRFEEAGAQSLVWTADPDRLIDLLRVLEEPPTFVLCEWGCYSQQFLIDGGEAVEGVYTWIPHTPFDAPTEPDELFAYETNLRELAPDSRWSEVGLQSWMSGRLFEAVFNSLIEVEPEAPTREQLIDIARQTTAWTAKSVLSLTDPAGGDPTACFVLMKVVGGRWVQEFPAPPRDKDCSEENLYELVTSRTLGVASLSATSSEEIVEDEEDPAADLDNPEEIDE